MKRWTKEEFMGHVCGVYEEEIDAYFDKHKTATILSVLNADVPNGAKDYAIWSLDWQLWTRATEGMEFDFGYWISEELWGTFETNIRAELKGESK